ncbi:MAG TPA: hypothetical protein VFN74_10580 [Chloroflexota bacterium]|nr:hypothetical protein [Chloroflexota bacterium]
MPTVTKSATAAKSTKTTMTRVPSTTKTAKSAISDTPLAKKLGVKAGYKVGLVNAPQGIAAKFTVLPEGVTVSEKANKGSDIVVGFLRKEAELAKVAEAGQKALKLEGVLWLCYLKGGAKVGTDLNRDSLWRAAKPLGLEANSQIALDDEWSAMRFRRV